MFLINSRPGHLLCPLNKLRRDPLSRSYGVILPSSLTAVLSSALGYSPRLPVSVLVRATISSTTLFSRTLLHRLRQQNGLDLAKPPRLAGGSALEGHTPKFNLCRRCRKVKEAGQDFDLKLATEAPVNGGRNYDGPKVAKFLVG